MKALQNIPKIYVGTYGSYHSGSLFGRWFDLTDYVDLKDFLQDCFKFHRNEFDPELMFQDWENIPDFMISECSLHKEAFTYFEATNQMDSETAEAFEIYCNEPLPGFQTVESRVSGVTALTSAGLAVRIHSRQTYD